MDKRPKFSALVQALKSFVTIKSESINDNDYELQYSSLSYLNGADNSNGFNCNTSSDNVNTNNKNNNVFDMTTQYTQSIPCNSSLCTSSSISSSSTCSYEDSDFDAQNSNKKILSSSNDDDDDDTEEIEYNFNTNIKNKDSENNSNGHINSFFYKKKPLIRNNLNEFKPFLMQYYNLNVIKEDEERREKMKQNISNDEKDTFKNMLTKKLTNSFKRNRKEMPV